MVSQERHSRQPPNLHQETQSLWPRFYFVKVWWEWWWWLLMMETIAKKFSFATFEVSGCRGAASFWCQSFLVGRVSTGAVTVISNKQWMPGGVGRREGAGVGLSSIISDNPHTFHFSAAEEVQESSNSAQWTSWGPWIAYKVTTS